MPRTGEVKRDRRPVPRLEDEGGSLADKATLEEALETLRQSREDED